MPGHDPQRQPAVLVRDRPGPCQAHSALPLVGRDLGWLAGTAGLCEAKGCPFWEGWLSSLVASPAPEVAQSCPETGNYFSLTCLRIRGSCAGQRPLPLWS